jgi:hypothetical protein
LLTTQKLLVKHSGGPLAIFQILTTTLLCKSYGVSGKPDCILNLAPRFQFLFKCFPAVIARIFLEYQLEVSKS